MGVIMFNGISSHDLGLVVESYPVYETAERDYDIVHVPGRNGDILIDKGSYKNVPQQYPVAFLSPDDTFVRIAGSISEWLQAPVGYARLEDSYQPEYFRLAICKSGRTVETLLNEAGRTTISFNCKPQRFFKMGEEIVSFLAAGRLRNPSAFESKPLITIYGHGDGVLRVGSSTATIRGIDGSVTIDCEAQDVYRGLLNLNSTVSFSNGFPLLPMGESEVSFSGDIERVEVTPKWWTL